MHESGDDRPAMVCPPGDHRWVHLESAALPEAADAPPTPLVATHRCRICGVSGMMEILNDGRPQRDP
jgi:hypothetical protein